MTTIIAGRFDQQSEAQHAISVLTDAGFDEERISSFYLGPPGRHDTTSIGGDHMVSEGAKHTDRGIAAGSAIGATIGIAATPLTGPAGLAGGTLLGAYLGSLVGSLSQTEDAEQSPAIRQSGMLIAVEIDDAAAEPQAITILRSLGAQDMERSEGTIENGEWRDFDPGSSPHLLDAPPH